MTVGRWPVVGEEVGGARREATNSDEAESENGAAEEEITSGSEENCCRSMTIDRGNGAETDPEKAPIVEAKLITESNGEEATVSSREADPQRGDEADPVQR